MKPFLVVVRRSVLWAMLSAWVLVSLDCLQPVSAATIVSTSRIPVAGFPDIVVTTFPIPRTPKAGNGTNETVQANAVVSIANLSCTTTCSGTAGAGPNQFDCTTIASSLRADGNKAVTLSPFLGTEWSFRSCKVFVTNQNQANTVTSTQKSVATVAQGVAQDCNAANGAAGGSCLYGGVSATIFVQHT